MAETNTEQKILKIPLESIVADAEQPRKHFDAARLKDLMESIKKHGIMNPVVVERRKDGTFLLIDGERRYRASKEIKLKHIPAIVLDELPPTDRLIKQFHIQEQHEGWTGVEKALAMNKLSKAMGMDMRALGALLGVPSRTLNTYISFASLLEKETFQKEELPLIFVSGINAIKAAARKAKEKASEDWEVEDERELEKKLIEKTKAGELSKIGDFHRVADSFRMDEKTVDRFMKKDSSVRKLYRESNAEAYSAYRRLVYISGYVKNLLNKGQAANFEKLFKDAPAARAALRSAAEELTTFVRQIS